MTPNPFFMTLGCAIATILVSSVLCILYCEGLSLMLDGSQSRDDACRRCRRGVIERVAASSAGDRFYLCHCCGARYRRTSRGGIYQDSCDPKYDRVFLRGTRECTSEKAERPVEPEIRWTRTIETLVWCKRSRAPRDLEWKTRVGWRDTENQAPLWDRELDP
jgi:hypothetical protein